MDDSVIETLEHILDSYKEGDVDCVALVAAFRGRSTICMYGNTAMLAGLIGALEQKLKEDNMKILFEVSC